MSIAETINSNAKSYISLLDLCRQYAVSRRLFKQDGFLLVEYIFKDSSNIIKNL